MITVEVKGLVKQYDWPADNIQIFDDPSHFYVFMCFDDKISDPLNSPSVWIIPSDRLKPFIKEYSTRTNVSRALVINNGDEFKNAWDLLSE